MNLNKDILYKIRWFYKIRSRQQMQDHVRYQNIYSTNNEKAREGITKNLKNLK